MKTVYLAGPITGLSYGDSTDWRKYCQKRLSNLGISCISPLRCKEYLKNEKQISDSYEEIPLSSKKGITTRDRWDVSRCDVVLMNLTGSTKVSIGTIIEAGWADSYRKPIVLCIEDDNIHQHAMLNEISGFVVKSLDSGLDIVEALLS